VEITVNGTSYRSGGLVGFVESNDEHGIKMWEQPQRPILSWPLARARVRKKMTPLRSSSQLP